MTIQSVAVIFDNTLRPETTGTYCQRALTQLVRVEHVLPTQLARLSGDEFDLYLYVDDGLDYPFPARLRPSVWWAIDTHLDFPRCLSRAGQAEVAFAAQRDGAARLREKGIGSASWLPLACDPDIHRQHDVPKTWDVCFVGNLLGPGPRAELIERIRRGFPHTFVGQRYFEEMARTYSASRLVFNCGIRNDINMRVFEALACGSLLLTNDLTDNGQEELVRDGIHLATYRGAEELLDKIQFYLGHETIRERIGAAGRAEALARHTYRQRLERLLAEVEQALTKCAASPGAEVPQSAGAVSATNDAPVASQQAGRLRLRSDITVPLGNGAPADDVRVAGGYFECARPELLALIPRTARRVLDVGCGAGRLGESVKVRQPAGVVGIELIEAAAQAARKRLDQVLIGDVERMELPFAPDSFDAILCGDVLEHLREPGQLLRRARDWLSAEGRLIASIPNVRHYSVVSSLLGGNWTYESAGLLDQDHVRFFTRRAIEQLFQQSGFTIRELRIVPGPGYEDWESRGRLGEVNTGRLHIGGMSPEEAEEFFVYQYLVVAAPAREPATVATASRRPAAEPASTTRKLRFLYLGNFGNPWTDEAGIAAALLALGHQVSKRHEFGIASPAAVLGELNSGEYDCLLFSKGRIGARSLPDILAPSGAAITEVLRRASVPGYCWYFDRAYRYPLEPSREAWMRQVAPLCRVVFVTEEALARTEWARWHLLRLGIDPRTVRDMDVPEEDRQDVGFIGQVYGERTEELATVEKELPVHRISGVYGSALSPVLRGYKIIVGPRYPNTPGYWSNRLYVVLGHGGFFLTPEVEGMREEGFLPGVHYAPLEADPVANIRYWLERPSQRDQIARAGRELVLSRFTYAHRVQELCRVIEETL